MMLGLFLLSFLVVSSTIARTPRLREDYDYYSTYDDSQAQTEGGSNSAESTTADTLEHVGAGDYSNNEDYANDDYSYYDSEPKEGGSNPTGPSEEEVMQKEEDSKKDNYDDYDQYWQDDESAKVGDQPDSGDKKDAQAETTQSSKEQESSDYYEYNLPEKDEDASLATEPSQLEKNSNEDEEDYNEDYDYSTNEEESTAPSKEEASPNYDNYDDNYDYAMKEDSEEMERPTQKEKDENDMTEQDSDYNHKDYEWHDSQNSKDYDEEDYVQRRATRGIKRVPRRQRPHRRPHQRQHKLGKQPPPEDITPTPTTHSLHPGNPASSHPQATSSSPPTVPTPSPESKGVEPSSREILLQHAIDSYTVATMHQLDASRILELYKQGDATTMKFAKTLFKTLVAMRLARVVNYRGFDKPTEVVSLLKKHGSKKHTDFFIVRFLCKYYKGLSGAVKYYLRMKTRFSTLELPRHGEGKIAHQNQDNIHHHYHHHFHHDGSLKHKVNKRDKMAKGGRKPKNYFKRKLEEFRKKRAIVAAAAEAAQRETENTANQHRATPDLDTKRIFPERNFRSKRSQRQRPHRPLGPILPAVYEAAQRQKAKEAGSTCRTNRGRIMSNGEIHKDDCNICKCRNGELHCTQLKCRDEPIIQISGDMTSTSAARKNKCQKCNVMPKEEVCGANGKTYNSLCHALNCGGLNIMDVRPGGCEIDEDPCTHSECEENEICVPRFRGPCIGLYGYGKIKGSCSLYKCVPRHQCHRARRRKVCGSNGRTYHSLCSLYSSGATLAYHGPCQPEKCSSPVCGSNGVTYKSSCHARTRSVRIDYAGECLADKLSKEKTCEAVRNEKMRCGKMNPKCRNWVIPHGSCCPICGSSFTMQPDTKEFSKLQESKNHLLTVKKKVSKLMPEIKGKCDLSASLGDKDDITFVLQALSDKDEGECLAAGKRAVDIINNQSEQHGDVIELLAPAALNQDILH